MPPTPSVPVIKTVVFPALRAPPAATANAIADILSLFGTSQMIKARAIVMPGQTDLYFPPEDDEYEVSHMPNAECRPIPSVWGHIAGGPGLNPVDVKFIDEALRELLANLQQAVLRERPSSGGPRPRDVPRSGQPRHRALAEPAPPSGDRCGIRRYTYAQLIISSLTTSARYKSVSRRKRTHRDGGTTAVQRVVEAWREAARRK